MASLPGAVGSFDGAPAPYKLVKDRKRAIDHRVKYAHGAIVRDETSKPNARAIQPAKGPIKIPVRKHYHSKQHPRYAVKDKASLTSDTSAEEDLHDSPVGEAADADVAYSFDAARSPTEGRDILSMAINKAVERFETKETEKLVKDEYEVLGNKDYEEEDDDDYFADEDYMLL